MFSAMEIQPLIGTLILLLWFLWRFQILITESKILLVHLRDTEDMKMIR